ncbi:MAG TPA: hypothetical protein VLS91_03430 [Acidimicrobiales bacterium]|nr:hypothetical protein [Acidimicrobiales bacterium]
MTIYVARSPLLLAMKLLAGRGLRDAWDIDLLLDACAIESFDEAMALFERYSRAKSWRPGPFASYASDLAARPSPAVGGATGLG